MREGINITVPKDLPVPEMARLVVDMVHRIAVHHGFWLQMTAERFGFEEAVETAERVWRRSLAANLRRFEGVFGGGERDGVPEVLLKMNREELLAAMREVGIAWLAHDGIWFQALEAAHGMAEAKFCNDACWTLFSPFEARSICSFLGLPRQGGGLAALRTALSFRLYAHVNRQRIDGDAESVTLFMEDCRVQSARSRKQMAEYPCKSAGVVEYSTFAAAVDPRIVTECLGCPPDPHPDEWWCAWRFSLVE